ncbi:hypothetical protein DICVIV_09704 [Dictyocaulus viviparus]|uniref:glucuronosyltransferase n=1 Tax=Dictyocaulus viviparus TaxID=29172 RepID=A0A0D8XHY6_DICVI|nr:hypothetical protein DICVIV_09704 [Dictyocaulus viviparus]
MNELRQQYFDVGIAEPFDICGFGMMSTKGDVMGILERLKNVIEILLSAIFFEQLFSMEILAFRTKYGNDFKSYEELLSQVSYVFTNSNPYLDYPRPSIHKSVDIGGITVSIVTKDKLPKVTHMTTQRPRKSLCEVFKAMPNTTFIWKYENEDTNNMFSYLSNVHLRDWLPQRALLADPRISSFVTHGGLGSTTEIAYMGIPTVILFMHHSICLHRLNDMNLLHLIGMIRNLTQYPIKFEIIKELEIIKRVYGLRVIMIYSIRFFAHTMHLSRFQIPLFGDQKRNANMLAKHGGAIVLEKHDLANPDKLIEAIQTILTENRLVYIVTSLIQQFRIIIFTMTLQHLID